MYKFIIDTDSYAGNFERELCGYCTGSWDYETHGKVQADIFFEEEGDPENIFGDNIIFIMNDHGLATPNFIIVEPKSRKCNSVGINFQSKPDRKQIDLIKERAKKYSKICKDSLDRPTPFKVIGFRLFEEVINITEIEI